MAGLGGLKAKVALLLFHNSSCEHTALCEINIYTEVCGYLQVQQPLSVELLLQPGLPA